MNPASWEVVRRPAGDDGDLEGFDLLFQSIRQVQADLAPFLSVEGLFIPTTSPLPHSSVLRFRVLLPDDFALIEGTGVVFWLRLPDEGGHQPAGMAVNFVTLGERSRELIEKIVETNLNSGGKPFDVHSKTGDDEPEEQPKPPLPRPGDAKKKVTLGMRQSAPEKGKMGMSFSVRGNDPSSPSPTPVEPVTPPPPIEPDPNATVWTPPQPKEPEVISPVGDPAPSPQLPVEPPPVEATPVEAPVIEVVPEPEIQDVPAPEDGGSPLEEVEQPDLERDPPAEEPGFELDLPDTPDTLSSTDGDDAEEALPKIDGAPELELAPLFEVPEPVEFGTEEPLPGYDETTDKIPLDTIGEHDDASLAEKPGFWVEEVDGDDEQPVEALEYESVEPPEFQSPAPVEPEPVMTSPENLENESKTSVDEIEPPSWGAPESPAEENSQEVGDPYSEQREMFEVPEPVSAPDPETSLPSSSEISEPESPVIESPTQEPQVQGQEVVFKMPEPEPESEDGEPESDAAELKKAKTKKRGRHSSGRVRPEKKSPIGKIAVVVILAAALGAGGYFGWQWYQGQASSDPEIAAHEGATEVFDPEPVSDTADDHSGIETTSDADAEAVSVMVEPEPTQGIVAEPAPEVVKEPLRQVAAGPARAVHGIRWESSPGGTDVVINCDAEFLQSQLSVFPMDDPPRILVRLRKIETGYADEVVEAGTDELQRIRIGFHPEQNPPALYIVLDVVDAGVVVVGNDIDGDILRVKLGR